MDITKVLEKLCSVPAVSGSEKKASKAVSELLREYTDDVETDSFGNVCAFIGDKSNGKKTLLLDAHIDEIGLVVTYIDDDGFIKVGKCGGIDTRLLPAQTVTIHGKKDIKGVISTLPPHVATDSAKAAKLEDIAIDTGYSKKQLEKIVALGDKITFDVEFKALCGSQVTSKAIDDRSGLAAIIYAVDLIKGKQAAYNIAVSFAVQEETGGTGATVSAYNVAPDFAIAVDVSFARTPGIANEKAAVMGKGAMIGVAPVLDRAVTDKLISLCEREKIAYQLEIMDGTTGTDADEICITKGGVRTALVSIPQKYMHTPVEVVDIEDIKAVGAAIAAFALDTEGNV